MSQVTVGDTVRIHYTGTLKNGSEFDSSAGREPLEFKVGENKIIPDLETSIVGMAVGETATVEIAAANAYGPRRDDAIQTVERTLMPEGAELEIGGQLQATGQDGQTFVLTIVEIADETVTLDANHPLAGEDLVFEVELLEIVVAAD